MIIAIRSDGGKKIGMGHIMRTLTLAKELKSKGNNVFYICKVEDNFISESSKEDSVFYAGIAKIISEGFSVNFIRENYVEDICSYSADLLITDSYAVDRDYFELTKKYFKYTAYIDDENKLDYYNVDFIINQNVGSENFKYHVNSNSKLLLGSPFVMLRNEFRSIEEKVIKEKVKNVMFTIGGSDAKHITEKLLPIFNQMKYKFHVVIGGAFENTEKLKDLAAVNVTLHFNANMASIMRECDIAISACGSTLYELFAMGVPAIGMVVAENQKRFAEKLYELGVIVLAGDYDKLTMEQMEKEIISLDKDFNRRKRMSRKGYELVDGRGVERIASCLIKNSN